MRWILIKTYKTSEVAAMIGIHPNTVRLYETLELIPKPQRNSNGYRIFTDFHIAQLKLARKAFEIEMLQNGLRKKIVSVVKHSAKGEFDTALFLTREYLDQVKKERNNAEEAIKIAEQILAGDAPENLHFFKRKEAAESLNLTIDTLRNWEMNGLLSVKRRQNGYRVYTDADISSLKLIRSLRCANFSLEAILHMLQALSKKPDADIKTLLHTPDSDADIISVCDNLILSLSAAEKNAKTIAGMLRGMKTFFQ